MTKTAKKLTARDLYLPTLGSIKQTVGKDNQAMIDVLVAHNKELVRVQATAGNWGWVISDDGIASKTSKGILSTDANGSKWEPLVVQNIVKECPNCGSMKAGRCLTLESNEGFLCAECNQTFA